MKEKKMERFQPGAGVTEYIGSDGYPGTVRKVSASGKTVWISRDGHRAIPGVVNPYEEPYKKVEFIPVDTPESQWIKYTYRKDGSFRRSGGKSYYLGSGRYYKQDPSY